MNNLILDAGVAVSACLAGSRSGDTNTILHQLVGSDRKLWLYTGQILEMLSQIQSRLPESESKDRSHQARSILNDFAKNCVWLSALSEDVSGLEDDDPIAIGLGLAAMRLGDNACVVTDVESRLARGKPFIKLESVFSQPTPDTSLPFIDLISQQDQIRPNLERNLHRVLHHGQYVMGSEIVRLESLLANYVGVDHCVCVSSGTDALLIAMMSLEIGPGDEVITTAFTFFAAVETIKLLGAKPIYVDVDPELYTLDPTHLEVAITDRTRAILPVSLYGQCAAMDQINEIAASRGIPVLEDGAQSFGATYKGRHSCGLSEIGCTSFFPAKPLGAYGDAGACFTQNSSLANKMREIRDHGQGGRYQHMRIGVNGRMDTLQAAVLLAKLDIFDDELQKRARVAARYSSLLKESAAVGRLRLPRLGSHNFSSWAQYTIEVEDRNYIQTTLSAKGIPTSIHYPTPVYRQLALFEPVNHCPVTEHAAAHVLSLPMHPYIELESQELVATSIIEAFKP